MSKQNKKPQPRQKALYRVKNWSEYDKALVQRGSITFWMSDDFDNRILFEFVKNPNVDEEEIFLLTLGSHDEVY